MRKNINKNILFFVVVVMALAFFVETSIAMDLQSWSDKFDAKKRFVVLSEFNNEAVLDRETQLVWERYPANDSPHWWSPEDCYVKFIGGRKGWRYPTIEELASLVDPNQSPALPSGHPFVDVFPMPYWSATTYTCASCSTADSAYEVDFGSGVVGHDYKQGLSLGRDWCVRGGHGYDGR